MIFYALYHPATGNYMPTRVFKQTGSGHTYWEPTGKHGLGGIGKVPRLFDSEHAAQMAKYYWETGPYKRHMCTEQDGWNSQPYEYQAGVTKDTTEQIAPRKRGDLIIVPINVTEA